MTQHYIDETTLEVFGYEARDGLRIMTDGEFELFRNPPKTIEQAKADKLITIEADYQTAITADITYLTKVISCDKDSLDLMAQNLAIGSVPVGFYWRTADNTDLPMTYAELQGLGSAIQTRGLPLFTNKVNRNIAVYTFDETAYPTLADAILAIEAI